MSDLNDRQQMEELLAVHRRRLRTLDLQQAMKGTDAAPEIAIEIDQLADTIMALERHIRKLPWKPVRRSQVRIDLVRTQIETYQPPDFATYLLWYLPRKDRDAVMGDLEEEFHIVHKRFGRRKAVVWYYFQVLASFWPYAVSAVKKLVTWGLVGWVGQAIRRFIP